MNQIQLSDGQLFTSESYKYEKDKKFPILLGSAYNGIYELGETIHIAYFFTDFKAEVVGFLKKDEKIMTNNEPEVMLNDYMIMPAINFSKLTNEQVRNSGFERVFFIASLDVIRNSRLITTSSAMEIRKDLAQISDVTEFYDFSIIGADGLIMDSLFNMSKVNIKLIVVLNLLILLIINLSIYYVLKMKVKYNQSAYLVLLISGIDYQGIKGFLFRELAYILAIATLVSLVLALIISFILGNYRFVLYFVGLAIVTYVFLLVCCQQLVSKSFKNVDIIQMLKRG